MKLRITAGYHSPVKMRERRTSHRKPRCAGTAPEKSQEKSECLGLLKREVSAYTWKMGKDAHKMMY